MNNNNPLSAYVIAGHLAFIVAAPLLFFIGGGAWLAGRLDLPDWTTIAFVLLGVFTMLCSLISYLYSLIKLYGGNEAEKKPSVSVHKDYYYED